MTPVGRIPQSSQRLLAPYAAPFIVGVMLAAILCSRIAIPVGRTPISAALPLLISMPVLATLFGMFTIDSRALIVYAAMMGICIATQLAGGEAFSMASVVLLAVVHLPYVMRSRDGTVPANETLRVIARLGLVLAFLAFAQVALQRATGDIVWSFPLEHFATGLIMPNYTNLIPIDDQLLKPNGVVLDEPSILSQVLAAALVCELLVHGIRWPAGVIAAALVATFSGTGLLMLAAAIPVLLIRHRRWSLLLLPVLLAPIVFVFAGDLLIKVFGERLQEFGDPQSSGYARFLGIFDILDRHVLADVRTMLFGKGAGSIMSYTDTGPTQAHDPTWGKMIFEYGLIGGGVYIAGMSVLLFRSGAPLALRVALAVQFFFTGGYALTPPAHMLILPLLIWPGSRFAAPAVSRRGVTTAARRMLRENAALSNR